MLGFGKKAEENALAVRPKRGVYGWAILTLKIALWSFASAVFLFSIVLGYGLYILDDQTGWLSQELDLPDIKMVASHQFAQKTLITDVSGETIGCFAVEDRVWKKPSEVSPQLIQAIMSSEDRNFPKETDDQADKFFDTIFSPGYDLRGITRAAYHDLKEMRFAQGGSTIYQQVIKNTALSHEKNIWRKARELVLAVKLKQYMSPQGVLEMYINMIYLGDPYGVESASQAYFHKSARNLSLDQAALLAGAINNGRPLKDYSRTDASAEVRERARERLTERRDRVLRYMQKDGHITLREYEEAVVRPIALFPYKGACINVLPYVKAEIFRQYSTGKRWSLTTIGGTIQTTIDLTKQRALDEACEVGRTVYLKEHPENTATFECAAMVAEIATGEILAMHGGWNFEKDQYVRTTQDPRPAGSSFKPIVYAALLKKRYDEEIVRRKAYLESLPEEAREEALLGLPPIDLLKGCKVNDTQGLSVPDIVSNRDRVTKWFIPHNYPLEYKGAKVYAGWVSCENALAESRNTAAVSILLELGKNAPPSPAPNMTEKEWAKAQREGNGLATTPAKWRYGISEATKMAYLLGITSPLQEFGTMPLGFNGVTLYEMMQSFETIVNAGCKQPLVLVRRVLDAKGALVEQAPLKGDCLQVLPREVARDLRTLMTHTIDDVHGTGKSIRKDFPQGALCGKTGTATSPDRTSPVENWFIGCTPRYLIGARLDNSFDKVNGYRALGKKQTGGRNGTRVWSEYCKRVHCLHPKEEFPSIAVGVPPELSVLVQKQR